MTEQSVRRRDPERRYFLAALLFAAVAVFANLGDEGIYAAQEGRTAIILRNMLRTGNHLEMTVKDGIPYEKPIGHYWLCLPSAYFAKVGGDAMRSRVEWGIRIPSALCSLLTVLLTGLLAKRLYGGRVGAMAMVMLATMSNFDKLGRLGHIDMPLAAAFTAAMYFLYAGYFEEWKPNRMIYLFYVALGWGMLLKGPLVPLLAAPVVLGMAATRGKRWYEVPRDLRLVRGALIVLAIALPWYIYECLHSHGEFFREFIVKQNLDRFTGNPAVYRRKSPIWSYVPKLIAGARPWSLVSLAGLIAYFKRIVKFRFSSGTQFLLIWFLTGFVFFSLSAVKRIDYLLPLFPALAILTARAADEWCLNAPALPRKWRLPVSAAIAGVLTLFFIGVASGLPIELGKAIRAGRISFMSEHTGWLFVTLGEFLTDRMWLLSAMLVTAVVLVFAAGCQMGKRRHHRAFAVVALLALGTQLAYHLCIEPGTDKLNTVKRPFAEEAGKLIGRGEKIVFLGDFNTELIYFLDRDDDYRFAAPGKKDDLSADDYAELISAAETWVIAAPHAAENLQRAVPGAWEEKLRTINHHQYPLVLLKRRNVAENVSSGSIL